MTQYWSLDTAEKRRRFDEHIAMLILSGKKPVVKFEAPESTRSNAQNSALHLWCEMVAKCLNDAGLDMRHTIREDVDIPWSQDSVKQYLWRPLQKVLTGETSTTKPSKTQYPDISATLQRHIASKFGVTLPAWPDRFGLGDADE
jgi:hypothetical protein